MTPKFEENVTLTMERVNQVFRQRGSEYGDTWRHCQFLAMKSIARRYKARIPDWLYRCLCTAGFIDMKYQRLEGGYKEDSIDDNINYQAYLAQEVRDLDNMLAERNGERLGDWFMTYTGIQFWPLDPRPAEIHIEDIAHALSNICRFGGHSLQFYSVAQHSLHVAKMIPDPKWKLLGLLHDATEAYIGDMIRPLKRQMPDYRDAEAALWVTICERYGLDPSGMELVKYYDDVALITERRDLVAKHEHTWSLIRQGMEPDPAPIHPMAPEQAEENFLKQYNLLSQ